MSRPLPQLDVNFPIRWQPKRTFEEHRAHFGDDLHDKHPGNISLFSLSPIGFDPSGEQALVSVGTWRGFLNSEVTLVLLERGSFGWYVVARLTYSVS